jgi:hypothetical protein
VKVLVPDAFVVDGHWLAPVISLSAAASTDFPASTVSGEG